MNGFCLTQGQRLNALGQHPRSTQTSLSMLVPPPPTPLPSPLGERLPPADCNMSNRPFANSFKQCCKAWVEKIR